MGSDKKKALIDFLSCLPDIIAKAQSESNIRVGFYENGMIDGDKSMYPVMDNILKTCKRAIPIEVYDKFIDNFAYLYKLMVNEGHITDEVYNGLEFFPKDRDAYGNEVERNATISQESYQRAKTITHPSQHKQRMERIERILADKNRVIQDARQREVAVIQNVKRIRDELHNILCRNNSHDVNDLGNCEFEHFLKPHLRAPD
eukprot:scaffold59494_cov16-Cyclotella_meneghiniana.AAC.1